MTGGQDTPFSCKEALSKAEIKEGKKQPQVLVEIYKSEDGLWHIMLSRKEKIIGKVIDLFRKPRVMIK